MHAILKRIQYCTKEYVFFRHDTLNRMRKNLLVPLNTEEVDVRKHVMPSIILPRQSPQLAHLFQTLHSQLRTVYEDYFRSKSPLSFAFNNETYHLVFGPLVVIVSFT